jgi:hypothetical protein
MKYDNIEPAADNWYNSLRDASIDTGIRKAQLCFIETFEYSNSIWIAYALGPVMVTKNLCVEFPF